MMMNIDLFVIETLIIQINCLRQSNWVIIWKGDIHLKQPSIIGGRLCCTTMRLNSRLFGIVAYPWQAISTFRSHNGKHYNEIVPFAFTCRLVHGRVS